MMIISSIKNNSNNNNNDNNNSNSNNSNSNNTNNGNSDGSDEILLYKTDVKAIEKELPNNPMTKLNDKGKWWRALIRCWKAYNISINKHDEICAEYAKRINVLQMLLNKPITDFFIIKTRSGTVYNKNYKTYIEGKQ
ncbi:MAG: hypothetical protein QXQ68_07445 [Candidatus Nitrosocaldaceae archaeon]